MKTKSKTKITRKKTKSSAKQALQNVVNRYCRLRDCFGNDGASCISCDRWFPFEKGDGGHFIAMGSSSALRYDERNINFQCHFCNRFKHGNTHNYYVGMVKKYGQETVDELMSRQHETKKWTEEEIKLLRKYYNEKIKSISRGLGEVTGDSRLDMSDLFSNLGTTHDLP